MYIRPNSHIRKQKETHVVVQLGYMMVYTHTVCCFTHTFSVFGFGKHLKRLISLR